MQRIVLGALALAALAACSDSTQPTGIAGALDRDGVRAASGPAGVVYTATNAASGNEVLAFRRSAGGDLTPLSSYPTGGTGTGSGLGNQGGVALSANSYFLFVVNAGSNELTAFHRTTTGALLYADRIASGGEMPVSVTSWGSWVYVLNAGGDGNIAGFSIDSHGELSPLPGSVHALSQTGGTGAAQIQFAKDGRLLVVTEKATNRIVTFTVDASGAITGSTVNASAGMTPFGFAFTRFGKLIVSEAAGGAPGAGSASSYAVSLGGTITPLTSALASGQSAPCWVAVSENGRYAYVTNTASNTVTGYFIRPGGTMELLTAGGATASTDMTPIDAGVSNGSQFLYVLNASGSITAYRLAANGTLTPLSGAGVPVPPGANGLAVR